MQIADLVRNRSTCLRRNVGAVLIKDKQILATGYNGAPKGLDHCKTCLREELKIPSGERHELCRAVHAEANCIAQAARFGTNVDGSKIYITTFPCSMCTRILINAGINEIVHSEGYPDDLSKKMLEEAKIPVRQVLIPKAKNNA